MNNKLYIFDLFLSNMKTLVSYARKNKIEVIYICHNNVGDGKLGKGTDEFKICDELNLLENDFMSGEMSYKYYNGFVWSHRYAGCISMEETLIQRKRVDIC